MMVELRCTECGKLLGKAAKEYEAASYNPDLELKCRKCGTINKYKRK
ncbi:Com family DNA-binding transcriptional regulator [Solibacillus silvestris]